MTDEAKALVERLREVGRDGVWKSGRNSATAHPMCIKAADLIETQAREIERLRTAGDQMLTAFAEGTNWTAEKRAAYEAMNAALAGDSHDQ